VCISQVHVNTRHHHIIPDDAVEAIKDFTFYLCFGLKTVTFPDGLEEIGGTSI
jgi:hypothetical protein